MTEPGAARDTLGMTEEEMLALLGELLQENAEEAAAAKGTSVEDELGSMGFAAARAAMSYAVHLIAANNAYFTRHLLDLGALPHGAGAGATPDGLGAEDADESDPDPEVAIAAGNPPAGAG